MYSTSIIKVKLMVDHGWRLSFIMRILSKLDFLTEIVHMATQIAHPSLCPRYAPTPVPGPSGRDADHIILAHREVAPPAAGWSSIKHYPDIEIREFDIQIHVTRPTDFFFWRDQPLRVTRAGRSPSAFTGIM